MSNDDDASSVSEESRNRHPERREAPNKEGHADEEIEAQEIQPEQTGAVIAGYHFEHYSGYVPPSKELAKLNEIDSSLPSKTFDMARTIIHDAGYVQRKKADAIASAQRYGFWAVLGTLAVAAYSVFAGAYLVAACLGVVGLAPRLMSFYLELVSLPASNRSTQENDD